MFRQWLISIFKDVLEEKPLSGNQITQMTREQLKSIETPVVEFDKKTKEEVRELLSSAERIFNEPAFTFVISSLIDKQTQYIAKYADVDNPLQNYMGRFTINGICLVQEEFERLKGEYLHLIQPKDSVNTDDIL